MADKDNNTARFGFGPGTVWTQDDDGNWVRIGDVPEEVKVELAKRGQKPTEQPRSLRNFARFVWNEGELQLVEADESLTRIGDIPEAAYSFSPRARRKEKPGS
jgi:hypothetical protein